MPLEALIFDVDGTLAETEEVHRQAFNESFFTFGLDWHWSVADYRTLLKTTGGKERIRAHAASLDTSLGDDLIWELHSLKTARYGEIIESGVVDLRPGIAELVANARANGLRLAVATTTNRPNVDALIRATMGGDAGAVFDVIAAGDEVGAKKPAPDVFLLALKRLGLEAGTCLAFEDSLNGLRSAMGAGLNTIVTPSRYTSDEEFEGALAVLDDLHALTRIEDLKSMFAAA